MILVNVVPGTGALKIAQGFDNVGVNGPNAVVVPEAWAKPVAPSKAKPATGAVVHRIN